MNKYKYDIRIKRKKSIVEKAKELIDSTNLNEIKILLEDCIMLDYFPKEIKDLSKKWLVDDIKQLSSDILKMMKDDNKDVNELLVLKLEQNIHSKCKYINDFKCYKFCFDTGAMLFTEGIYACSHSEAWQKAFDHISNEYQSLVLSAFCVSIDGEKTNTLSNMNGMFTPKIGGQMNGVKADDLLENWRK